MPTCTVFVGLPGSGKSTCIQSAYTNPTQFVYSTDDLLEVAAKELGSTYNDVFETLIKSVTKSADNMLAGAIKQNKDVVWDQTN
jgi:adenylate kinase